MISPFTNAALYDADMNRHVKINSARTLAQSHFRTLRLGTPFQPRI
ncbi:aminomethyl transferase family protein, partial [Mesorhizobium sp. M1A.F.Ca.IN.022.02.1.1]